jgi:hypothetical protein
LDHVPPIFGFEKFKDLANNYAGSKSFRETMQFLQNAARKIGDGHLHTQIRNREVLPNQNQVNFSSAIDVLLAEVVRISKTAEATNEQLRALVARAEELMEDFLCPNCRSPISKREYGTGVVGNDYGDYIVDWEEVFYECGLKTVDGDEVEPCPNSGPIRAV